jgi:DNA polymerase III delta prime subunit
MYSDPYQAPFLAFPDHLLLALLTRTYVERETDENSRYRDFDVPWKRGIIFHGPPGNGKTLSLRALMHSLSSHQKQRPKPITLLYVKSIPYTYSIRLVLSFARLVAPCLLLIEDIDTQITPDKLSYFFNEVDGLENNDGILMIATTNHLEKLDEGLKRPSRFDRRYFFPLPELEERTQYSEFWRLKLERHGAKVEFPKELSRKIAGITSGFSFATMKEAFIATLLALARNAGDKEVASQEKGHDGIEDLPLWKEMQVQVKLLRKEMGKSHGVSQNFPNPWQSSPALTHPSQSGPREAAFNTLQEHDQPGPRTTLCPPGSLIRDYQSCQRGSALPFRGPPPPTAMSVGNVTVPLSHQFPNIPGMAGQDPAGFAGGSHPQEQAFPKLLGQNDVRDKELGMPGGYYSHI